MKWIIILGLVLATPITWATPQLSLLTGNRCVNCHVAPAGGGLRNGLGWYSWYDVGMVPRDADIVKWMYSEEETNEFFDGLLTLGMDLRVQSTRSFSRADAPRVTFPMQATLYAAVRPIKAMTVEGQFNLAALRKAPNSSSAVMYDGQRAAMGSVMVSADSSLPSVRIGLFRPAFGVRYDDHTVFPVNYVTSTTRQSLLAPDWGEWGSELTWEQQKWLTVNLGLFGSQGLSNVRLIDGRSIAPMITGNSPTVTARVIVWPRFAKDMINTYAGGSVLLNDNLSMVNAFAGAGLTDKIYVMLDYMQTKKESVLDSRTVMAELGWSVWSPLLLYGRFESGQTEFASGASASLQSMVFGAQAFLLPYVEVRPEYRVWDTSLPGMTTRWNVQLHVFY